MAILNLIPVCILHHLLPYYPNSRNIPHALVFLITEYNNKNGKAKENSVNTMESVALCEQIRTGTRRPVSSEIQMQLAGMQQ
jgi:hypothetical protein